MDTFGWTHFTLPCLQFGCCGSPPFIPHPPRVIVPPCVGYLYPGSSPFDLPDVGCLPVPSCRLDRLPWMVPFPPPDGTFGRALDGLDSLRLRCLYLLLFVYCCCCPRTVVPPAVYPHLYPHHHSLLPWDFLPPCPRLGWVGARLPLPLCARVTFTHTPPHTPHLVPGLLFPFACYYTTPAFVLPPSPTPYARLDPVYCYPTPTGPGITVPHILPGTPRLRYVSPVYPHTPALLIGLRLLR